MSCTLYCWKVLRQYCWPLWSMLSKTIWMQVGPTRPTGDLESLNNIHPGKIWQLHATNRFQQTMALLTVRYPQTQTDTTSHDKPDPYTNSASVLWWKLPASEWMAGTMADSNRSSTSIRCKWCIAKIAEHSILRKSGKESLPVCDLYVGGPQLTASKSLSLFCMRGSDIWYLTDNFNKIWCKWQVLRRAIGCRHHYSAQFKKHREDSLEDNGITSSQVSWAFPQMFVWILGWLRLHCEFVPWTEAGPSLNKSMRPSAEKGGLFLILPLLLAGF